MYEILCYFVILNLHSCSLPSTDTEVMLVYLILFVKTLAVYFRKLSVPTRIDMKELYSRVDLLEFGKLWNKGVLFYLDDYINPFAVGLEDGDILADACLLYTSPSPRDS